MDVDESLLRSVMSRIHKEYISICLYGKFLRPVTVEVECNDLLLLSLLWRMDQT